MRKICEHILHQVVSFQLQLAICLSDLLLNFQFFSIETSLGRPFRSLKDLRALEFFQQPHFRSECVITTFHLLYPFQR